MTVTRFFPGDVLTGMKMNMHEWQMVTQVADLTLSGGGTAFVPTEIVVPLDPGAVYYYLMLISYSADIDADFRWRWDAPEGCLLTSFTQALVTGAASGSNTGAELIFRRPANTTNRVAGGTADPMSGNPPGTFNSAYDEGCINASGVGGNLILEVDRVSDSADAILRGGNQTRILYRRIA